MMLTLFFSLFFYSSAQICSQLTNRLERQQAAHAEELDALKVREKLILLTSFLLFTSSLPPSSLDLLLWDSALLRHSSTPIPKKLIIKLHLKPPLILHLLRAQ